MSSLIHFSPVEKLERRLEAFQRAARAGAVERRGVCLNSQECLEAPSVCLLAVPAEAEGAGGWGSDEPSQLCRTFLC